MIDGVADSRALFLDSDVETAAKLAERAFARTIRVSTSSGNCETTSAGVRIGQSRQQPDLGVALVDDHDRVAELGHVAAKLGQLLVGWRQEGRKDRHRC